MYISWHRRQAFKGAIRNLIPSKLSDHPASGVLIPALEVATQRLD
jgi:hypothetical protein